MGRLLNIFQIFLIINFVFVSCFTCELNTPATFINTPSNQNIFSKLLDSIKTDVDNILNEPENRGKECVEIDYSTTLPNIHFFVNPERLLLDKIIIQRSKNKISLIVTKMLSNQSQHSNITIPDPGQHSNITIPDPGQHSNITIPDPGQHSNITIDKQNYNNLTENLKKCFEEHSSEPDFFQSIFSYSNLSIQTISDNKFEIAIRLDKINLGHYLLEGSSPILVTTAYALLLLPLILAINFSIKNFLIKFEDINFLNNEPAVSFLLPLIPFVTDINIWTSIFSYCSTNSLTDTCRTTKNEIQNLIAPLWKNSKRHEKIVIISQISSQAVLSIPSYFIFKYLYYPSAHTALCLSVIYSSNRVKNLLGNLCNDCKIRIKCI